MDSRISDTYQLKDLYKQIDLLDRKIAHCQNLQHFEADRERIAALNKLNKARGQLVKKADGLTRSGLRCDPKDLPRSFRVEQVHSDAA